ncbi:regulator of chromosome condensation, putative [Plasmodium gallinaceum]|uniref:Regulator of chromosome condensation, putative n=1 Tax=Plasmodium gallinaceum TaxID=5849 RepID=A0A1J1H019_PLAGA|nr:regulator of chromosome condensation, putative [Plasmodium gallinaceum]CRG98081.1 regulator of chromosome condensation, putative [Plasmodium gallinaceum]
MKEMKNTLFIFGSGECGQLPPEYCTDYIQADPTPVQNLPSDIDEVICGSMHTIIKTKDDKLYSFGCNDMGVLGRKTDSNDTKNLEHTPTLINIKFPSKIKKITCGDNHTAILLENGKVYITGGFRDYCGVLGLPSFEKENEIISKSYEFIEIKFNFTKNKNSNFKINESINAHNENDNLSELKEDIKHNDVKIINIISGEDHLICLDESCEYIYTLGNSDSCQVCNTFYDQQFSESERIKYVFPNCYHYKDFNFSTKFKNIFCGGNNTFIQLEESLDVYGIGRNAYGSCGVSLKDNIIKKFEKIEILSNKEIKQLCGGQSFTVCLLKNNDLYIWGNREILGIDSEEDAYCPLELDFFKKNNYIIKNISCGTDHCLVLTENEKLFGWGTGGNEFDINTSIAVIEKNIPSEINFSHFINKINFNSKIDLDFFMNNIKIVSFSGGSSHCAFISSHLDSEKITTKRTHEILDNEEVFSKKQKIENYLEDENKEKKTLINEETKTHKLDIKENEEKIIEESKVNDNEKEIKKVKLEVEENEDSEKEQKKEEIVKMYLEEKKKQIQSLEERKNKIENVEEEEEEEEKKKKIEKEKNLNKDDEDNFFKEIYHTPLTQSNRNSSPAKEEFQSVENENIVIKENNLLNEKIEEHYDNKKENEKNKRKRSLRNKSYLSNESPTRKQPRRSCKENTSLNENVNKKLYQIVDKPITKKRRKTAPTTKSKVTNSKIIADEKKKSKSISAKKESISRSSTKKENFKRECLQQTPEPKVAKSKSRMKN